MASSGQALVCLRILAALMIPRPGAGNLARQRVTPMSWAAWSEFVLSAAREIEFKFMNALKHVRSTSAAVANTSNGLIPKRVKPCLIGPYRSCIDHKNPPVHLFQTGFRSRPTTQQRNRWRPRPTRPGRGGLQPCPRAALNQTDCPEIDCDASMMCMFLLELRILCLETRM